MTIRPACYHPVVSPTPTKASDRCFDPCFCHLACPTLPIPSDRDRAESMGAPVLRLPPTTGVQAVTTTNLNVLGAATEKQFSDSAACYSHADWAREQQTELVCHARMRQIVLGRPVALPIEFLSCFLRASALPSQRLRNLLEKDNCCTPPTMVWSCSSLCRLHPPRAKLAAPGRACVLFIERRAFSHLRAAAHAPLSHTGLPFDGFLPPRHHAHPANARTFLLMVD